MIQLSSATMGPGFQAVSLRGHLLPMGHVLNVDHFHMSRPTFPPHPHAGFSAVTYMLPWSPGAFTNRDSLGDRSRIAPGAVHWTRAGAGMLHEEIPEQPGQDCEGLQIFVKLPAAHERARPQAFHVEEGDIPRVGDATAEVRVLSGAYDGAEAAIATLSETTLLHVRLRGGTRAVEVPAGVEAFALVLSGEGRVGEEAVGIHAATGLGAGANVLASERAMDVLVGWSPPMPGPVTFRGPFAMFGPARVAEAIQAYQSGEMGSLAPSS